MRRIEIIIDDDGMIDVYENGKCCGGLGWDEMVGQIAAMTISKVKVGGLFSMKTKEEWQQERMSE